MVLVLNSQQREAVEKLKIWWQNPKKPFIWQGYAGTGKTTSIREALNELGIPPERVALVTPTNRSAKVAADKSGLKAHTLHSLMFKTITEEMDQLIERLNAWEDAVSFPNAPNAKICEGNANPEDYRYSCEIVVSPTVWYYDGNTLPENPNERAAVFEKVREVKVKLIKDNVRALKEEDMLFIPKSPEDLIAAYDIIVADEASMIDEDKGRHISNMGIPVIYTGDPFQLPPVNAKCFWDGQEPNAMLTEIMRQRGEGAGIPLAGQQIRLGKSPMEGEGMYIHSRNKSTEFYAKADIIVAGTHKTRRRMNEEVRRFLGFRDVYPQVGEKVVSFSNFKKLQITNGEVYTVAANKGLIGKHLYLDLIDPFGTLIKDVPCWERIFRNEDDIPFTDYRLGVQLTFGYCITCHRAQGGEWDHVIVCDDWSKSNNTYHRWLYTAITRASKRCDLVQ